MEMMPGNAVVFSEMALGLVPEVFDAVDVDMFARDELFGVIDPMMLKAGNIQDVMDARWASVKTMESDMTWLLMIGGRVSR